MVIIIPVVFYFFDLIPFSFDYPVVWLILIITVIFGRVASGWPKKVVTTLNPAVALGYE